MSEILEMGLTPQKIAQELDRFIVGQSEAKKAVALALRNRMRRKMVPQPMRDEIVPKNILMVGPTGVGKTEIARRLAKLAGAPFIKVEATKFTEVGYVGRDVESIIRDLLEIAINNLKIQEKALVQSKAREIAIDKIVDSLASTKASDTTREKFTQKILSGQINDSEIEIEVVDSRPSSSGSFMEIPGMPGAGMGMFNVGDILAKSLGGKPRKKRKMLVKDAIIILTAEEAENLLDEDKIVTKAIDLVQNDGIVFLDEIDKIASRNGGKGAEVSREGVQRDLLPLIEGSTINTKYGSVKTDHILFIASGAFHLAKPSDLLPELQGRLPIRVELLPLSKNDMVRVLTEPESSLLKQYTALLETEGIELTFENAAIDKIADIATIVNNDVENIGARRLHTILEKLLEEISFNASEMSKGRVVVDLAFVEKHLSSVIKSDDLSKFIL
jgi:ATP-dependent HslUV protease ATP-binding subunit HslU